VNGISKAGIEMKLGVQFAARCLHRNYISFCLEFQVKLKPWVVNGVEYASFEVLTMVLMRIHTS
jgi:hypothetical protein